MESKYGLTVLFVEDEDSIRESYVPLLQRRFAKVVAASDGESGLAQFREHSPDLILTDISMPGMNGLEMVRQIRQEDSEVAVIFLSAYTEKEYLLEAIEVRPIKYFVKPVNFDEFDDFFANEFERANPQNVYLGRHFYFDYDNSVILHREESIKLTQKEREFIQLLIRHNGNLVSYDLIESSIWKEKYMSSDSLRTLVKKIRKKSYNELIENVSNTGYKIVVSE